MQGVDQCERPLTCHDEKDKDIYTLLKLLKLPPVDSAGTSSCHRMSVPCWVVKQLSAHAAILIEVIALLDHLLNLCPLC